MIIGMHEVKITTENRGEYGVYGIVYARNIYYPDAKKKYQNKVKQYKVQFSLSDDDQSIVAFLENEMQEKGMSANAYIKDILTQYVNSKYK